MILQLAAVYGHVHKVSQPLSWSRTHWLWVKSHCKSSAMLIRSVQTFHLNTVSCFQAFFCVCSLPHHVWPLSRKCWAHIKWSATRSSEMERNLGNLDFLHELGDKLQQTSIVTLLHYGFCAEFDTVWLLLCTKEDTLGYIGHDWAALSLPNFYLHFIFVASGTLWKSVSIRPVAPRQPVLIGLGDQRTEAGSLDIPGISSCFFQLRIGLLQLLQVRAAASWKSEILALLPADFPAFALETGRGERQGRCAR